MNFYHEPFQQISLLQQCLSQDKKPLGLFLGAGCPLSIKIEKGGKILPLIPDIAGITEIVKEKLSKSKDKSEQYKKLNDHFVKDGNKSPNVEEMLSHIRSLRTVVGKGTVRGLAAKELDMLDFEICRIIHELADKSLPSSKTPYHQLASWIDAVTRSLPVEVFTPNYDLLIELAFEELCVPYFDGFAGACKPFFDLRAMEQDVLPPRWARLWKLHGSINWYQDEMKPVFRGSTNEKGSRRVIHPSHLKYDESRRMPYLAMIDRLRAFLKQPYFAFILCGYSFRDDHINEVIVQGLQSNQTGTAFALLFNNLKKYSKAIKLALERSNLSLLARDEAIIGRRRAKWNEQDVESIPEVSQEFIKWIPSIPNDKKSKHRAELNLGDYVIFGRFLHELIGHVWQPPGVTNAE